MSKRSPLSTEAREEAIEKLISAGTRSWERFLKGRGANFHHFIPADYHAVLGQLRELRSRADTFLELGSGVGVITILADLLGFDAYGIEIEAELVRESVRLAAEVGSSASFALGSFVPPEYRDEIALLDSEFETVTEGADGYAELGLMLCDFDLVYVYPWPGEEDWLRELVRQHAGPHASYLTYSLSDGFELIERIGAEREADVDWQDQAGTEEE